MSKFARLVWLAVGEEAKQRPGLQVNVYCRDISFFVQCTIKQLLDSVFVISRIVKVEVRVSSRKLRLIILTESDIRQVCPFPRFSTRIAGKMAGFIT